MKADIIWLASIDSTNEEAKRRISDIDNLSVVSALEQTSGRGQRGNAWDSTPGENLLFSIVLKSPSIKAEEHFALNEITALSVIDFLSTYGVKAKIKWPNDIYVGEKKICGILIENSFLGRDISSSIIGIGLNINQRNFNVRLPNPTSLLLCRAQEEPLDIQRCLNGFMDIFTSYHDRFLTSDRDLSPLRQRYLDTLWRSGKPSLFIDFTILPTGRLDGPMNLFTPEPPDTDIPLQNQTGKVFPGIIRGLSETGNLLVEDLSTGLVRQFGFKEIGYIL